MTAFISRVAAQYMASDALVLPVEAQAARLAPIARACVNAAVMPLSLKLPEGFMPFVLQVQPAGFEADVLADARRLCCRSVCPSPIVTTESGVANGSSSWKRQMPLKRSGSLRRRPHFLEIPQRLGRAGLVPVVGHVEQVAALGAGGPHLLRAARVAAGRADAPLKGKIGQGHGWKRLRGQEL